MEPLCKKVFVRAGFTREGSRKKLRTAKEKWAAKGWNVVEVFDGGLGLPRSSFIIVEGDDRLEVVGSQIFVQPYIMDDASKASVKSFANKAQGASEATKHLQAPTPSAAPTGNDPYEQLEKLASLKEKGILTEEEFTIEKTKLLKAAPLTPTTALPGSSEPKHPLETGMVPETQESDVNPAPSRVGIEHSRNSEIVSSPEPNTQISEHLKAGAEEHLSVSRRNEGSGKIEPVRKGAPKNNPATSFPHRLPRELLWFIGGLFILAAGFVLNRGELFFTGCMIAVLGLIFFPEIRFLLRTHLRLTEVPLVAITAIGLLVGVFMDLEKAIERATEDFQPVKAEVLSDIEQAIREGRYVRAENYFSRYVLVQDKDLKALGEKLDDLKEKALKEKALKEKEMEWEKEKEKILKEKVRNRAENIRKQFSRETEAHIKLEEYVKSKYDDSYIDYKYRKTRYTDKGNHILVEMDYNVSQMVLTGGTILGIPVTRPVGTKNVIVAAKVTVEGGEILEVSRDASEIEIWRRETFRTKKETEDQRLLEALHEEVRKIPALDVVANMRGYQRLKQLDPDNQLYQHKYDHYRRLVVDSKDAKILGKTTIVATAHQLPNHEKHLMDDLHTAVDLVARTHDGCLLIDNATTTPAYSTQSTPVFVVGCKMHPSKGVVGGYQSVFVEKGVITKTYP